jgi:transposase InsO family protein
MPWKKYSVSEARMRFVLAIKSKGEVFASVCARFGISRKSGYKWWQRYRAGGVKALADRSRRPLSRWKKQRLVWRDRLGKVRRKHPSWGAKKLRRRLQKAFPGTRRIPAVSTLARWLVELGLVKKRQRRARRGPVLMGRGVHAPKACNEVWTIDFKGWFRTGDGNRCEPLTVRDLFSRYVLAVALLSNQSDAVVRRAMVQIFHRYGLPKIIRVDNGAPFGGKGALGLSRLSVWWLRLGIAVEFVRPAHPEDNGAHEQMHRVLRADVAKPPAPSIAAQKRRLRAWIRCYNQVRPHEALGQRVPAQIYWPSNQLMPVQLSPVEYPCGWESRRVRNRGHIKWHGRERFIGRAFVGQRIGLKRRSDGAQEVYLDRHLIGLLYEQDAAGMRPASIARHP